MSDTQLNRSFKIAGTDYDRRRKLSNRDIYDLKRSYNRTKDPDINILAERYNVSPQTIRYHIDPEYKAERNRRRVEIGFNSEPIEGYAAELADYKRKLLSSGKRLNPTF